MKEGDIMNKNIEIFNNFVMNQNIEKMPIGLFYGKMGLSIYHYHQARLTDDNKHKVFADKLLNSVIRHINDDELPINLDSGLTGICWGIIYLIENGFVEGSANYTLKDLDDKIFKMLYIFLQRKTDISSDDIKIIVHCALYYCKRLTDKRLFKNEKELFKQIIIKIINKVESSFKTIIIKEPFIFSPFDYIPFIYLSLIKKVYEFSFYTYKTEKVCDEWSDYLISSYPLLQTHKFLLSNAMKEVNKYCNLPHWDRHIDLLKQQTNMEYIISIEFRNRNILLQDGLAGFYLIAKRTNPSIISNFEKQIKERLATSELWDDFYKADNKEKMGFISLINGLSGVILAYQNIQ